MKTILMIAATAITTAIVQANPGTGDDLKVNTEKSKIFWTGRKITGEHTGTLMLKGGTVKVESGKPTSVDIILDMNTIVCTDLTDPGTNAKLVGHLKSDDFFSVEKHPEGRFVASSFLPLKGAKDREPNYMVKGQLTLKGITQEIEFPAYILVNNGKMVANGEVTFDRTKFEIKYGSGNFFKGLGDKAIKDEVSLTFVFSAAE